MKIQDYINRYGRENGATFELLERTCKELERRGMEPRFIEHQGDWGIKEGEKYIAVTQERRITRATAIITVYEGTKHKFVTKSIVEVRIPRDASDRVINNRIDKVAQYL